MAGKRKILSVKVKGKNTLLWEKLKSKLLLAMEDILDTVLEGDTGDTLSDEIRDYYSAVLDYGTPQLAKAGLKGEKTLAEIEKLYSGKLKELAQTKKLNAEAEQIAFGTKMKKLRVTLAMYKMLVLGEEGEEQIFITKQVDTMIMTLGDLE